MNTAQTIAAALALTAGVSAHGSLVTFSSTTSSTLLNEPTLWSVSVDISDEPRDVIISLAGSILPSIAGSFSDFQFSSFVSGNPSIAQLADDSTPGLIVIEWIQPFSILGDPVATGSLLEIGTFTYSPSEEGSLAFSFGATPSPGTDVPPLVAVGDLEGGGTVPAPTDTSPTSSSDAVSVLLPTPGATAVIGLAGLVAMRRRRAG